MCDNETEVWMLNVYKCYDICFGVKIWISCLLVWFIPNTRVSNECVGLILSSLLPTVYSRHKCTGNFDLGLMLVVTTMAPLPKFDIYWDLSLQYALGHRFSHHLKPWSKPLLQVVSPKSRVSIDWANKTLGLFGGNAKAAVTWLHYTCLLDAGQTIIMKSDRSFNIE